MKRMKKMKRILIILSVGLLCITCFTGCRNMVISEALDDGVGMNYKNTQAVAENDYDYYAEAEEFEDADWSSSNTAINETRNRLEINEVAGVSASNPQHTRKIIRNAYLSVETSKEQDMAQVYGELLAFCGTIGGHEFSGEINNGDSYSYVMSVMKIPPDKLDDFLNYVGDKVKIINSRIDADDVTAEFYDLTTRLETKRKSLESYYKLLENADSVEEIIQIQRTIDNITEEIEATEGRLRVLADLVDMATVTLSMHQENDPDAQRREVEWGALSGKDMGYYISSGFKSVINTIAALAQWLVIILLVTSPLWLPVTIILIIVIKRYKKNKAKRLAEAGALKQNEKDSKGDAHTHE